MKRKIIITLHLIFCIVISTNACSIYAYMTNDGLFVGRNFDWIQKGGTVEFIGNDRVYGVQTKRFIQIQQMGSDRPYEGINSSGLFIAMNGVLDSPIIEDINLEKPAIDGLGLIRYVLERADNVDEALCLMNGFKIDYNIEHNYPKLHYMIADSSGSIAIYEEGKEVIRKDLKVGESVSITNFHFNSQIPCDRLNALNNFKAVDGKPAAMNVMEAMNLVYVESVWTNTIWTSIYNLSEKSIILALENDRETPIIIDFEDYRTYHRSVDIGELKMRFTNPLDINRQ